MAKEYSKKRSGIKLVKKANKLVESRYKFDIWETRVFLSVLALINREDEDFQVYRIWYKDVIRTFGLKSGRSYEFLRDAAKGLMRKVFYVTNYEKGHKRETEYHIIRSINYLAEGEKETENQEYIDITIDPEMKPLLLQLGNNYKGEKGEDFTAYDLRNIIKLGAYHVRIYELLKQYQKIGKRKLEIEEIKRMLEIGEEYPMFGNLFQKVIKPAVKKINNHTDLTVTRLEKIKTGRKVVALYFEFKNKQSDVLQKMHEETAPKQLDLGLFSEAETTENEPPDSQEGEEDKVFNAFFKDVVERFGVTPSVFLNLLKTYNEEQVAQAVRVTNRAKFLNQIKTNIAGFFIQALKHGYTDPKEEARKKAPEVKKNRAEYEKKKALFEAKMEDLEAEKQYEISERIKEILVDQPEIADQAIQLIRQNRVQKILLGNKEKELGRVLDIDDFREDRGLRAFVISNIVDLAKGQFDDIFEQYQQRVSALREEFRQHKSK